MHKRLLMKDKLTLKGAVKIVIGMETVLKDAITFHGSTEQQEIHQVKPHVCVNVVVEKQHNAESFYHRLSHCHNFGRQEYNALICRELRHQERKFSINKANRFEEVAKLEKWILFIVRRSRDRNLSLRPGINYCKSR